MSRGYIRILLTVILTAVSMIGLNAQDLLNPMPSEIIQGRKKPLDVRKGFVINDVHATFAGELGTIPLKDGGIPLKIDYGQKPAEKKHVRPVSGAYSLSVAGKGVTITGYDELGAFHGILTLRQLLKDSPDVLKCVEIKDCPSVHFRGVMETYACPPSSHADRLRRLDDYASKKLNIYFYAPADDKVRSSGGWKYPYGQDEMSRLKELMDACQSRRMEFVWTIAPGETYHDTDDDYKFLLNKLVLMYYSGIRSFHLITDGAEFRKDIGARLQRDFVDTRREKPSLYLEDDLDIHVISGKQKDSTVLRTGPKSYPSMVADDVKVVFRFDRESAMSKLDLFAAVDWCWNPGAYDPMVSWERSFSKHMPEVRNAFRLFAIYADSDGACAGMIPSGFTLASYSDEADARLMTEFQALSVLPDTLAKCRDRAIYNEIRPWVIQAGRLGKRGVVTLECMRHYLESDQIAFLKSYVGTTLTEEERKAGAAYKFAFSNLSLFCDAMSAELASVFYKGMNGAAVIRSHEAVPGSMTFSALDGNLATFMECTGKTAFEVPAGAAKCHLLFGEHKGRVLFRQLSKEGKLLAELVVRRPYVEMEIKPGTAVVDVLGEIELFETIFVNLQTDNR